MSAQKSEFNVALEKLKLHQLNHVDDPTDWSAGKAKWTPMVLLKIALYFLCCLIGILTVPNVIWDIKTQQITLVIGTLGIWRYGWWFTHAVRAYLYGRFVYPDMSKKGREIWARMAGGPGICIS